MEELEIQLEVENKNTEEIQLEIESKDIEELHIETENISYVGGASDYNILSNKPSINGVELTGNKTTEELGIEISGIDLSEYATKDELNNKVDKVVGKSLILDTEIERLSKVDNYDDTEIKELINGKADVNDIPKNISELTNDSGFLTSIPDEYITESELDAKGYLKNIPNEYVTETELTNKGFITTIPSEYITESELNNKGYLTSVPDEYITETKLNNKGYLTSVPSEYVTETELNNKGFITDYTESDPTVPNHVKAITESDIARWNQSGGTTGTSEDIYATTEQRIGTWLGKPLYRIVVPDKIIQKSTVYNETTIYENFNIDTMVRMYGTVQYNNGCHQIGAYGNANFYSLLQYTPQWNKVYFYGANNYIGYKATVILEFTKTTD